jgi:hypothetical protein
VVPSLIYVAEDGRVFVARGTAHLHHPRRPQSVPGWGSLRDVQELAGHISLAMTQRYIEGDTEAKRKLVALL